MMELGKPNLDVFAATLLDLAQHDRDVIVVTSDSRGSGRLSAFAQELPDQLIEVGIAEQNLVGIAAGLAAAGKNVYAVSPASFLTARSLEQVKNDVAYSDHPVKLIGISAGVSYGALGSTHHAIHDLAALRAIHNIDIVVPADNMETESAIRASLEHPRPLYIRFGKRAMYHLPAADTHFRIGEARILRQGNDVCFLATGETVETAVQAAERLAQGSISARVISMHTIKPLDVPAVLAAARQCRAVITVEEHHTSGGLGEACAALILQAGIAVPFRIVALPDVATLPGSQLDVWNAYGISAEGLARTAQELLGERP